MNYVSSDIRAYHLGLFVFFPGVFLNSRVTDWSLSCCDHGLDLVGFVSNETYAPVCGPGTS